MVKFWEYLKTKWGVSSDRRMTIIFIVFAITGTSTLFVRKWIYSMLNIDISNAFLAFMVKMVFIYIIYQILLWLTGTIFGERKFFTWFLKKMNYRLIGKKVS